MQVNFKLIKVHKTHQTKTYITKSILTHLLLILMHTYLTKFAETLTCNTLCSKTVFKCFSRVRVKSVKKLLFLTDFTFDSQSEKICQYLFIWDGTKTASLRGELTQPQLQSKTCWNFFRWIWTQYLINDSTQKTLANLLTLQ